MKTKQIIARSILAGTVFTAIAVMITTFPQLILIFGTIALILWALANA